VSEEKQKLDNLDLEEIMESVDKAFYEVGKAWKEKDYVGVVTNLLIIAERAGEISPLLAPVISELVERYGSASRPFSDELIKLGTKTAAYFYDAAAKASEDLLPELKKYATVKAQIHAMKLRALRDAGFSRREAVDIILAEISGSKQSQKSWVDSLRNINIKSSKSERRY